MIIFVILAFFALLLFVFFFLVAQVLPRLGRRALVVASRRRGSLSEHRRPLRAASRPARASRPSSYRKLEPARPQDSSRSSPRSPWWGRASRRSSCVPQITRDEARQRGARAAGRGRARCVPRGQAEGRAAPAPAERARRRHAGRAVSRGRAPERDPRRRTCSGVGGRPARPASETRDRASRSGDRPDGYSMPRRHERPARHRQRREGDDRPSLRGGGGLQDRPLRWCKVSGRPGEGSASSRRFLVKLPRACGGH